MLATDGLSAVVLRLSTVYGPGDVSGLMPRAVCAVGYQHLGEQMKFLWDAQTRLNTVCNGKLGCISYFSFLFH